MQSSATVAGTQRRIQLLPSLPFVLAHLAVLGALWSGVTVASVVVAVALYFGRMFFVTAGYHRYFSHKSFKTSRAGQFVLAFMAQTSSQKGALWWAAHHRRHHKFSDQPGDLHSPRLYGLAYAHVGWILDRETEATDWSRVKDLERYPELVWLNRWWIVPPVVLAAATLLLFGWPGLFIGFFASTVALWHGSFVINSLAHVMGRRRWPTRDDSRNSFVLALITMGEGWHNNHHWYMASARQGFYWWEIDGSYYVLRALERLGLVWGLKAPPASLLDEGRARDHGVATAGTARRPGPALPPPSAVREAPLASGAGLD